MLPCLSCWIRWFRSMSFSEKYRTFSPPQPNIDPTCYQLTAFESLQEQLLRVTACPQFCTTLIYAPFHMSSVNLIYTCFYAPEVVVSFSLIYVCTTSCKKNKRPTSIVTQSPSSKVDVRLVSTTCGLAGVTAMGMTTGALVTQHQHWLNLNGRLTTHSRSN